ncbi:hypothetical protein NPIL_487161 [Nephila pilipes]|uniref:Uncharacterized protein n=1 Tax=Nephila pilipes TaxID=299642 RepID=A0A8X6P132_NEPPI|nr:hypothetical protein NPIL_487161 [Nephila pilipes]
MNVSYGGKRDFYGENAGRRQDRNQLEDRGSIPAPFCTILYNDLHSKKLSSHWGSLSDYRADDTTCDLVTGFLLKWLKSQSRHANINVLGRSC